MLLTSPEKIDADTIENIVVGVAMDVGRHDSGMHSHNKGQLLYAPKGCITFSLQDSICILPPTKAVWIPPNTPHSAHMINVVSYRSLYFDVSRFNCPEQLTMIEINEVLRALINKMALWPWDITEDEIANTNNLFWEEFSAAKRYSFTLPLPTNKRLLPFANQVEKPEFIAPTITTLANQIGASNKTVTRLFKKETGMSYQEWKQQWRLFKSVELLSKGQQVADVAYQLAFSSDSAFIAFFKKQTGQTPLAFMKSKSLAFDV